MSHLPLKRRKFSNDKSSRFHQNSFQVPPDYRKLTGKYERLRNCDVLTALNALDHNFQGKCDLNACCNQSNLNSDALRFIHRTRRKPPIILEEGELVFGQPIKIIAPESEKGSDTPSLVAKISKQSSEEMLSNRIASTIRVNTTMNEYALNENTLKKVNALRYREEVFMAASRLVKDMPPYPPWCYRTSTLNTYETIKINVGGQIFELFQRTVQNLCYTRIGKLLEEGSHKDIVFIDRDPVCFSAIINLYRTGRLHVPPNICLSYFEEELNFWGIDEQFIESCCWGDYSTSKIASEKLKRYSEDSDRSMKQYSDESSGFKMKLYRILSSGTGSVAAMWVALMCAFFIITGIVEMVFSTTPIGRVVIGTGKQAKFDPGESVTHFLTRTRVAPRIETFELVTSGFFTAELLLRFIVCPIKLEFFRDTFNWIDIIATVTSFVVAVTVKEYTPGKLQAYTLILKIPRIFRLLKLTADLRTGIDAFVLTIFASAKELQLVFFILLMVTVLFACLVFAVEMLNPTATITSLYIGMWWAIETLPGVGYGDYIPGTVYGRIIGAMCIMSGVIVCQMPVPIFLKNFSVYYSQASARLVSQTDLLLCQNLDKSEILQFERQTVTKNKERESLKLIRKI